MIYHYITGGRRNSYFIKYPDIKYHDLSLYPRGKKKFFIKYSDNIRFITISQRE